VAAGCAAACRDTTAARIIATTTGAGFMPRLCAVEMRRCDLHCRFDENLRESKENYYYHPHGRGCT